MQMCPLSLGCDELLEDGSLVPHATSMGVNVRNPLSNHELCTRPKLSQRHYMNYMQPASLPGRRLWENHLGLSPTPPPPECPAP